MTIDNPRFQHTCEILHTETSDDPLKDEGESVTIYSGCCRSGAYNTTDSNGEVVTSVRRLSIPMRLKDWKQLGVAPSVGDTVNVDKDGVANEYGKVIDFLPNTLGTTILYDYART